MISIEQFKEAIKLYQKHEKLINDFEKLFPGGFIESKFADCFWRMQDLVFKTNFDQNGLEWINAYLYENCREYWDENKEHHEINDLNDLWELIKEYRI